MIGANHEKCVVKATSAVECGAAEATGVTDIAD